MNMNEGLFTSDSLLANLKITGDDVRRRVCF